MEFFLGGIDSPSINAFDPVLERPVHITKYLSLKSKTTTEQYLNHLYERIAITSDLYHPNVRRILSWYIADACLYSITDVLHNTLRHAIQHERFSLERIRYLSSQIISGTIYLQAKGLCPLTPWYFILFISFLFLASIIRFFYILFFCLTIKRYTTNIELTHDDCIRLCSPTISTTKLNGVTVQYHHLWRYAPERLIRLIIHGEALTS